MFLVSLWTLQLSLTHNSSAPIGDLYNIQMHILHSAIEHVVFTLGINLSQLKCWATFVISLSD